VFTVLTVSVLRKTLQALAWLLSNDQQHAPEALAICAASAALAVSNVSLLREWRIFIAQSLDGTADGIEV
jgi:polyribonucleotide nucleotidyltransferase